VPAGDPEAAAAAALELLNDPAAAARLGAAGRAGVRPWDSAAQLLMEQYRAVCGPTA
jgi:hypothetical protein